ncbi:hypothetical protein PR048_010328 [Dryococelus australis]|uniref:Uncharacterized protein n=1 Tax=Dryococelus australis TaxID=614101 RepID=A0ABQ9I2E6_9NEOP|nr:hypothetical protein PR048_010328 [Dryococelus australis]
MIDRCGQVVATLGSWLVSQPFFPPASDADKCSEGARIFWELGHSEQLENGLRLYKYRRVPAASSLGGGHLAKCESEVRCETTPADEVFVAKGRETRRVKANCAPVRSENSRTLRTGGTCERKHDNEDDSGVLDRIELLPANAEYRPWPGIHAVGQCQPCAVASSSRTFTCRYGNMVPPLYDVPGGVGRASEGPGSKPCEESIFRTGGALKGPTLEDVSCEVSIMTVWLVSSSRSGIFDSQELPSHVHETLTHVARATGVGRDSPATVKASSGGRTHAPWSADVPSRLAGGCDVTMRPSHHASGAGKVGSDFSREISSLEGAGSTPAMAGLLPSHLSSGLLQSGPSWAWEECVQGMRALSTTRHGDIEFDIQVDITLKGGKRFGREVRFLENTSWQHLACLSMRNSGALLGIEVGSLWREPSIATKAFTHTHPGVTRPGIEPGSSWWETSRLTARRMSMASNQHGNNRISLGYTPGCSCVGIVPEDAAGRRVSSGFSHLPRRFIPAQLHTHLNHPNWLSRPRCYGRVLIAISGLSPLRLKERDLNTKEAGIAAEKELVGMAIVLGPCLPP